VEGEREIARLDEIALGSERRGPIQAHEDGLPSYRGPDCAAAPARYSERSPQRRRHGLGVQCPGRGQCDRDLR
jgi:hypothetical protein